LAAIPMNVRYRLPNTTASYRRWTSARSVSSGTDSRLARRITICLLEQNLALLLGRRIARDLRQRLDLADHHCGHAPARLPDLLECSLNQPAEA
jgi:hypothetical protein